MESSIKNEHVLNILNSSPLQQVASAAERQKHWVLFNLALFTNDLFMTTMSLWLAYTLRFEVDLPIFRQDIEPQEPFYFTLRLGLVLMCLIIFSLNGLYKRHNLLGGSKEYSLVFRATSICMLAIIVLSFFIPSFLFARGWLALSWIFVFLSVSCGRFLIRRTVYRMRYNGYFVSPTLIIGSNEEAISLVKQLTQWYTSGLHVVGFVSNEETRSDEIHDHLPYLGTLDNLQDLLETYEIEELILVTSAVSRQEMVDIFRKYGLREHLNVRLSSGLFEIITTGLELKEMNSAPLVQVKKVRLTGFDYILKRTLDYTVLAWFAVPGFFIFTIIGLLIKLTSPGPVFHRRRVMGLNGQEFYAYKFRTMYVDGDEILSRYPELQEELARNHKLKNDPRTTPVGNMLRKTSLDELPQFINVLRGEMSLVGPRMISPPEMAMYQKWEMNLLTVLPGMSGLWQISGRSDISYEDRVNLDMYYVRNWSIWLDLLILFQTVPAVIRQRGAY